jgi:hypothetical protein
MEDAAIKEGRRPATATEDGPSGMRETDTCERWMMSGSGDEYT